MSDFRHRVVVRLSRRIALILAILGAVWAAWLAVFGGFDATILGVTITSNEPMRPLVIAAAAGAAFVALGGRVPLALLGRAVAPAAEGASSAARVVGRLRVGPTAQAVGLSLAVTVFGVAYSTTAASGADSYGYVSQADLWLAGDLVVEQPWVEEATWPTRRWSFAPLGYRPSDDAWAIVPTYSPGLAMLMAGAKAIGGQEGLFWVVPILGGVLVIATFGIARRVAPPGAAVVAAWLMATCPVMLYMIVWPMSDVPVAGAWMAACYLLIGPGIPAAAVAGLCASVAVLIRPNLVFLAAILALWPLWRAARGRDGRGRALGQVVAFGACASVGPVVVALINQQLYGSPSASGYGDVGAMFDSSHLWPNLIKYGSWLVESQTPAALVGVAALLLPWRRIWPEADHRRFLVVSAGSVVSVWLLYALYLEFDAWWFLRFMMPVLPFIAIGLAAVIIAIRRSSGPAGQAITAIVLVLIVFSQYRFAVNNGALGIWRDERRYVSIGRLVREHTDDNSMVISAQHSGSLRYYAGRMTLRFDNMDGESLDEAVAWLASRGVRPYLLVEDWEIPSFRSQFAGQATLAVLDTEPLVVYRGPATAMLFDLTRRANREAFVFEDSMEGLRSAPPAPPARLVLR